MASTWFQTHRCAAGNHRRHVQNSGSAARTQHSLPLRIPLSSTVQGCHRPVPGSWQQYTSARGPLPRPAGLRPEDKATSPAPTSSSSSLALLSSPSTQSAVFTFFSASSALLAAAALFSPDLLINTILPPLDLSESGLTASYLRVAGATMIMSSVVEYCLMDAAANNRLTSATYQRLMLGCIVKSSGFLLAFSQAREVWTLPLLALYPTMAVLSIAANTTIFANSNGLKVPAIGLKSLAPLNVESGVYAVFSIAFLLLAGLCYAPPGASTLFYGAEGPSAMLLKHTWAPGFFISAIACINLRDAADRGRLGASTFKRLNLGLGLQELTCQTVHGSAMLLGAAPMDGPGYADLGLSLVIAWFCLYQWLYATK